MGTEGRWQHFDFLIRDSLDLEGLISGGNGGTFVCSDEFFLSLAVDSSPSNSGKVSCKDFKSDSVVQTIPLLIIREVMGRSLGNVKFCISCNEFEKERA